MSNYTLDTGKKYIKEIFASHCFYNIPEYQRPYVWGEDQISALLDDITSAMEHDKNKEYFLGCMIWNTKNVKEGDIEYVCQDILDGQQRFITLYLLQAVIRDFSTSKQLHDKVQERMLQEEDQFDGIPKRSRIEFQIRDDKNFIDNHIITKGSTSDNIAFINEIAVNRESSTSIKNMANAILSLRKWWLKKFDDLDGDDAIQKYLNDFYNYLSLKVLALYLATPDNLDDAYNLFTVLNSRGLQLQVSDILRAQNLRVIADEKQRKEYAKLWETYESSIDAPYKSFDEFLWAMVFIKMKYRSDDNLSLTKAFNFMYERKVIQKGSDTFDFIGRYIKHFEAVTSNNFQSDDTGSFFSNLNYILTSTFGSTYIAPLMHYRECFGEYRIVEFILKLDNLCSASWLLGHRGLQSRIFMMLRKMDDLTKSVHLPKQAADDFLNSDILKYEYQDEKASTALDIEKLYELFDKEKWGSFSGTKINKTRYLLLKLDLLLSNFHTQLYFNKTISSVEHLIPQKIEGTTWEISEDDHKQWLHKLGNIILVDRKKNSSLSNLPYAQKSVRYAGAIENRANTNYIFITYKDWNIETVHFNHFRVNKLLKDYYSGNSLKALRDIKKNLNQSSMNYTDYLKKTV
ncbi:DUF262 domain-containing protein [Mucilaginibacter limnophilus]|uniref:DUF262 domain-containing protein n=1 Tax=Mucilaginibacter limnophilus TaxID=1932778 RepID=A0A3S2Y5K6_9SPHI|nr:DUF262 domain-containing protein [Mucilaginibacter limnophilus]RVU02568.1 DUF262 domain-containing protein [Mucilaginibacter limnophilus]